MPAALVTSIAGESEETRALREQLTKQLDVLLKGSETCKRFVGARLFGERGTARLPVLKWFAYLFYRVDATDDMIQPDSQPESDFTEDECSEFDTSSAELRLGFAPARPTRRGRSLSPVEAGCPRDAEACASVSLEVIEATEEIVLPAEPESWNWRSGKASKKSKKGKISERLAVFES